jgi:hypothetical protein
LARQRHLNDDMASRPQVRVSDALGRRVHGGHQMPQGLDDVVTEPHLAAADKMRPGGDDFSIVLGHVAPRLDDLQTHPCLRDGHGHALLSHAFMGGSARSYDRRHGGSADHTHSILSREGESRPAGYRSRGIASSHVTSPSLSQPCAFISDAVAHEAAPLQVGIETVGERVRRHQTTHSSVMLED